jgi:hypothetical protein
MGSAATPRHTVRRIVSNTGPLLHLSEAQALQILSHAGEIHIPKAVEIEMTLLDSKWRTPSWIAVDLPRSTAADTSSGLAASRVVRFRRSGSYRASSSDPSRLAVD